MTNNKNVPHTLNVLPPERTSSDRVRDHLVRKNPGANPHVIGGSFTNVGSHGLNESQPNRDYSPVATPLSENIVGRRLTSHGLPGNPNQLNGTTRSIGAIPKNPNRGVPAKYPF